MLSIGGQTMASVGLDPKSVYIGSYQSVLIKACQPVLFDCNMIRIQWNSNKNWFYQNFSLFDQHSCIYKLFGFVPT